MTTKKAKSTKKPFPFHVLIFAIYPVFSMLARNIEESFALGVRSLVVALLMGIVLAVILWLILKNLHKAALLASLMLMLFFSYGQVQRALKIALGETPIGITLSRHLFLIPLFAILLALGVWIIVWKIKKTQKLTLILNLVSIVLLIFPSYKMISFAMETAKAERQAKARQAEIDLLDQSALLSVKEGEIPPDIYYIILDGYTRADALQELFDFDNSYFLDELEKMGFYVADCAMSNYAATKLCLATTLNLDYQDLDELDPQNSHPVLEQKIRNSLVWQELGKLGYTRVSFDTGYRFSNMNDADYFLTVPEDYKPAGSINNFETLFIRSTALTVLIDKQWLSLSPDEDTNQEPFDHAEHVIRERYKLETLHTIAELPSPKFVFAHIIIPHHPYIFRPNGDVETDPGFYGNEGRAINDEYRIKGYVQQIEFINSQMLEILDNILKQSANPPIIIMQGDHGTEIDTNLILSTYYLPGGEEKLYPNITPINTFRIVLNEYFHTIYPLLPDISLYSDHERILDQVQVFEENPACILP